MHGRFGRVDDCVSYPRFETNEDVRIQKLGEISLSSQFICTAIFDNHK